MQILLHCNLSGAFETRASTRHAASIVILLLLSSSLHLELCDLLKGVNVSARGSYFAKFSLNCIRLKLLPWKPICLCANENPSRAFLTYPKTAGPFGKDPFISTEKKYMLVFHIVHSWYYCVFVGWQSSRSICIHQRNCNVSSPIWIGFRHKPLTPPVSDACLCLWTKTESICLSNAELPRFKPHLGG